MALTSKCRCQKVFGFTHCLVQSQSIHPSNKQTNRAERASEPAFEFWKQLHNIFFSSLLFHPNCFLFVFSLLFPFHSILFHPGRTNIVYYSMIVVRNSNMCVCVQVPCWIVYRVRRLSLVHDISIAESISLRKNVASTGKKCSTEKWKWKSSTNNAARGGVLENDTEAALSIWKALAKQWKIQTKCEHAQSKSK